MGGHLRLQPSVRGHLAQLPSLVGHGGHERVELLARQREEHAVGRQALLDGTAGVGAVDGLGDPRFGDQAPWCVKQQPWFL